jgi:hypothetical protein
MFSWGLVSLSVAETLRGDKEVRNFGMEGVSKKVTLHSLILHKDVHSKAEVHISFFVGFDLLTAASVKAATFWVVAPCNLADVY